MPVHFEVAGLEVPPWIFAAISFGFVAWQFSRTWLAIRSEMWPHVTGTITLAQISPNVDSDGDEYFSAEVGYSYLVAGECYEGSRLAFRAEDSGDYSKLVEAMSGVTAGRKHRVYYSPKYPSLSVLKPGTSSANYVLLVAGVVVMLLALYAQVRHVA
jgi:hypothetical protein